MLATKTRRRVCKDRASIVRSDSRKIFLEANQVELKQSECKTKCGQLASKLLLIALCCSIARFALVSGEDAAPAPAFDMGALASLASNLGSNPQIMSMVSSFLNSNNAQKPGASSLAVSPNGQPDLTPPSGSTSDMDPNSIMQADNGVALRRGARQDPSMQTANIQQQQQAAATMAAASQISAPPPPPPATQPQAAPGSSGSLNGLLSMMPGVLSSLASANNGGPGEGANALAGLTGSLGGSLGPLTNLLGLNKNSPGQQQQQPSSSSSSSADNSNQQNQAAMMAAQPQQFPSAAAPHQPNMLQTQQQPPSMQPTANVANPAQSVINQVLTAYVSGQIPNELIQMGLSGRVPPQIIELALSGQVPPQIIQMIITGQVPMSTINAFLAAMQATGSGGGAPSSQTAAIQATTTTGTMSGATPRANTGLASNMFSTTRALFEALFGLGKQQGNSGMPTLLGSMPFRIPSIPNVRSLGQMVGGTITNVASMIPF